MSHGNATTLDTSGFVQPSNSKKNLWMLAGGIALGAVVASAVWGFLMWRQMRRHQDEIIALTGASALVGQAGRLIGNATMGTETIPSVDEVKAYLDGKTLPLPEEGKPGVNIAKGDTSSNSVVLKPEHIESMSKLDTGGSRSSSDPWRSSVVFLVKLPEGRFAVNATVDHLMVGKKRAFYGWAVQRVARVETR